MKKISDELKINHLDVIKINILNNNQFPYKSAAGAILDSGDYKKLISKVLKSHIYKKMITQKKEAHKKGKLYGIGFSAIIEPSISNMGYITTALTHKERSLLGIKVVHLHPQQYQSDQPEVFMCHAIVYRRVKDMKLFLHKL